MEKEKKKINRHYSATGKGKARRMPVPHPVNTASRPRYSPARHTTSPAKFFCSRSSVEQAISGANSSNPGRVKQPL